MNPATIAKSITAGGVALCGSLATALSDGHVSVAEGLGIAAATLVAAGAVWGVPNAPAKRKRSVGAKE